MRQGQRAPEAGFTFVEVMIALFMLSFIAGGMAMISIHASRSSTYAQRLTRANAIAEDVLEKSRNTAFESLNVARTETVNGSSVAETCATVAPVTTCTFHGCMLVPEGVRLATARMASSSSRATGVGRKARTLRREPMAQSTAARRSSGESGGAASIVS
jgi:Tfp pilus assembly protein PilV